MTIIFTERNANKMININKIFPLDVDKNEQADVGFDPTVVTKTT